MLDIVRQTPRHIVGLMPVEDDVESLNRLLLKTDRAWVTGHYRLNHPLFKVLSRPRKIFTVLRDPIDRMISNYNFTARVQATPWHDEVASGKMSLLELTDNTIKMFGHQWSYFDKTGDGLQVINTGVATPEDSFKNFRKYADFFDFSDHLNRFSRRLIELTGAPISTPFRSNATINIPTKTNVIPFKKDVTDTERRELERLLESDIWFVEMARREYRRRFQKRGEGGLLWNISSAFSNLLWRRKRLF